MTNDDIINTERDILSYNKKGWNGSKGAILLQKAGRLIDHYKREIKQLRFENMKLQGKYNATCDVIDELKTQDMSIDTSKLKSATAMEAARLEALREALHFFPDSLRDHYKINNYGC